MCLCRVQCVVQCILGMLATSIAAQRYAGGSSMRPQATPLLAAPTAKLDQHVQAVCKQVAPLAVVHANLRLPAPPLWSCCLQSNC